MAHMLSPSDEGYDEARRVHNGMIDKRPALIAQCATVADVVDAVRLGREDATEIAVRGGGHGVAGNAVTEGGLMIDLAPMKDVSVDAEDRTIRAQPGVIWRELDAAAAVHGLATTGGVVSTTGIAGLTLGGGIGWLMGRYGLTVDNLLSAEVVTADGEVIVAREDAHPDLFWALRGGGGNFGVVTSFEYRAHPVREVLAGPVLHAWGDAAEAFAFHRDFTRSVSDELTVGAALLHAPDGSGAKVAALVPCHCGPVDGADAEVKPLRSFGAPLADLVEVIPYPSVNQLLDGAFPRGALNYWKSAFLTDLSDAAISTLVDAYDAVPSAMSGIFLDHVHGAAARVDPAATAFAHRVDSFSLLVLAQWTDPDDTDANVAWAQETFEAMRPFLTTRRYTNFMSADDGAYVHDAYGDNYARLVGVKRTYDPDNVFHLNNNIDPGG